MKAIHRTRGKKPVSAEAIEKIALQVEEDKSSNVLASTSVRRVEEALDLPCSTVQKIMRNILLYYPYKLKFVQELLPRDFETRHLFSQQFLARLQVDLEWPWNILWTDEAHFHLDGSVNTHNCRIWETDNPHSILRVPLHSPKVTAWCGFSASFILGPYFFEELGAGGPVICSITGQRYASLLRNKIIPDLQARQCLSRITFMPDGAPPHITRCVTDVLKHHFTEERVISRQFRHLWPPRSPDLNPCDFWLWGHLKQLVCGDQPKTLPDLKDSISRHVLNISQNTLRSTMEHAILRFQIVAENDGIEVLVGITFQDGDRFNSCQVIYSQFGLAIHQNDHQARRRFVEWSQNEIAVVPDFHKRILFSDEAHFWLNGYVNKQNCRIWSEANPQVYVETPLHLEKLTVWCALWAGGNLLQKR
ncbi:transposable element tc3 transposase [Trichonephila clavipes]|nr:transposable element tc3 transposase [Trichonephila clavipes]